MAIADFINELVLARRLTTAYRPVPLPVGADDRCPPLFQFGGGAATRRTRPIVVISIEPLLSDVTYETVCTRVLAGFEEDPPCANLQLDYFEPHEFPSIAPAAIGYWRGLHTFARGWVGDAADAAFEWSFLSANLIEVPYSPYHAPSRERAQLPPLRSSPALDEFFRRRLEMVVEDYQPRAIVALGIPPLNALRSAFGSIAASLTQKVAPGLPAGMARDTVGARYFHPWHHARLVTGSNAVPVLIRRAPFTNRHLPLALGIWALGRVMRAAADEMADA
jgi:hypothetical protein